METVTIQKVYDELKFIKQNMVSKQEFNSMVETMEILHNHNTMKRISESEEDIKLGKTKRVRGVKDILAQL